MLDYEPGLKDALQKKSGKCLSNLWQINLENGSVYGNIDFSMLNLFFNSYFIQTFSFLKIGK